MDCRPSLRGEIKKARHSQYDLMTCLLEFIDNALDTKAKQICIDIKEKQENPNCRKIQRIFISDDSEDGMSLTQLSSIFSWTYDRMRKENDIGEFGTGFKCAAVNLGSFLHILTHSMDIEKQVCYWEAIADWESMMEKDRWEPHIVSINHSHYQTYHPYPVGTTFIIDHLCTELFQTPRVNFYLSDYLYSEFANYYKYYLRHYTEKHLEIRGHFSNGDRSKCLDHTILSNDFHFPFDQPMFKVESHIHVYRDQAHYFNFFVSKPNTRMIEMVECLEKRKNGNHHLRCCEVSHRILLNMTFLEDIVMKSCYYKQMDQMEDIQLISNGTIDLIYRDRLIGKNISFRKMRNDTFTDFIKHEIHLPSKFIFPLLGVSFNKKAFPIENELHFVCEYLQMYHERELIKKMTECVSVDPKTMDPKTIVSVDPKTIDPKSMVSVETKSCLKRKNFSNETKLVVLQEQVCRDSMFDFVLKDSILPFDYDHRDGRHNNSKENCQILSVLSHALKTRKPTLFQYYSEHKLEFIIQLLNCITSSQIFLSAWSEGKVHSKTVDDITISQGIFFLL